MRAVLLWAICVTAFLGIGYFFMPEQEVDKSPSQTGTVEMIAVSFPNFTKERFLRVYLPDGYGASSQRYPVIYMHDGQNLYDNSTSYAGEWGVDETLSALQKAGKTDGVIVVGIDNSDAGRMSEYAPWDFKLKKFDFRGTADDYLGHLVTVIKPMIDQKYRTKPEADHTAIMGSSLGGLVSLYGGLKYPNTFGKVAALSPSLMKSVVGDNMMTYARLKAPYGPKKIYLDLGDEEAKTEADLETITRSLAKEIEQQSAGQTTVRFDWIKGGIHKESSWRKRFGDIVLWLDL